MGLIKTYDPANSMSNWGGMNLTGFAEGDMVKVSRKEGSVDVYIGSQGEEARVIKRNRSGEITLRFAHTANINDFMSTMMNADELMGLGVAPFSTKDGLSMCSTAAAWISKPPDFVRSNGIYVVEWTLECGYISLAHFGVPL